MNTNIQTNDTIEIVWRGTLAIAAVAIFAMIPLEALAVVAGKGEGTAIDQLFCNIIRVITGTIGKGIATIALIVVGVGALMGKVSWGMAIIVALGIAIVFGAGNIVQAISGQGQGAECTQFGDVSTKRNDNGHTP